MRVELGISARHAHVTQETLEILFGAGAELHNLKDVKQPGQFAAEEVIIVEGPKGSFPKVRILGPVRSKDQVELSISDCFKIGVKPIVRESGDIENTPGVKLIGPQGEVEIKEGVIVAARHVHLCIETAKNEGIADQQMVKLAVEGPRAMIFENVLARVSDKFADEVHLDTDEANAAALCNKEMLEIIK